MTEKIKKINLGAFAYPKVHCPAIMCVLIILIALVVVICNDFLLKQYCLAFLFGTSISLSYETFYQIILLKKKEEKICDLMIYSFVLFIFQNIGLPFAFEYAGFTFSDWPILYAYLVILIPIFIWVVSVVCREKKNK